MKIPVKSNETKYFRQVLEFLSPLSPFNTISGREKDVLSQLLYYNWKVGDLPKEARDAYIFSKSTKERMRASVNISKQSFDNQMAALRRKNFITYNSIDPKFEIKLMDPELVFSFQL